MGIDRKQYNAAKQREYRLRKSVHAENVHADTDVHAHVHATVSGVDKSIFDGKGRGVPVDGFVLIAGRLGADDYIVTESTWLNRLKSGCKHASGWSCKLC